MAEWLRRTLKARVRKSVGSIPTDCTFLIVAKKGRSSVFFFFGGGLIRSKNSRAGT